MWALIAPWLAARSATLLKWAAIALGVLGLLLAVRRSGRLIERTETLEKELHDAREANKIRADVARMPANDVNDELRRFWTRSGV